MKSKPQPDLFEDYGPRMTAPVLPSAPHNHTPTSQAAAASLSPETLGHLHTVILAAIRGSGLTGMTCDQVELELQLSHQTASARVHELARRGRIVTDSTRPTRSGRRAQVWRAAP